MAGYNAIENYVAVADLRSTYVCELCRNGQVNKAVVTIQESTWVDAQDGYFKKMAEVLCDLGQLEEALTVTMKIRNDTARAHVLWRLACRFRRIGRIDQSLQLTQNLLNVAEANQSWNREDILLVIPAALAAAGQVERAFRVVETFTERHYKAHALNRLGKTLMELGDYDQLARVVDILASMEDEIYCTEAAATLAQGFVHTGRVDDVSALADGPYRNHDEVRKAAAEAAAEIARFDTTLSIEAGIVDDRCRQETIRCVVHHMVTAELYDRAYTLAKSSMDKTLVEELLPEWIAMAGYVTQSRNRQ